MSNTAGRNYTIDIININTGGKWEVTCEAPRNGWEREPGGRSSFRHFGYLPILTLNLALKDLANWPVAEGPPVGPMIWLFLYVAQYSTPSPSVVLDFVIGIILPPLCITSCYFLCFSLGQADTQVVVLSESIPYIDNSIIIRKRSIL